LVGRDRGMRGERIRNSGNGEEEEVMIYLPIDQVHV
jgi:hypothetical protein